jgi:hypothetical protein
MATIDWPAGLVPQEMQLTLRKSGTQFASPFNGTLQAVDFIAERWVLSCSLAPQQTRDPKAVGAFCNRLAGGVERVRVWPFHTGGVPRGTLRGVTVVAVAAGRGDTALQIAGAAHRDNLLVATEKLDAGEWGIGIAQITPNTHVAPDGALTAETITDNITTSTLARGQVRGVSADTSWYTASCFVRKTSGGTQPTFSLQLYLEGGTALGNEPRFNTDTGAVLPGVGTGTVQNAGDYWRVSTSLQNNGTNTLARVMVVPALAAHGQVVADPTIVGSAVVWGFQLEPRQTMSGYTGHPSLEQGDFLGVGGQLFQVDSFAVLANGQGTVPLINRVRGTIAANSPVTWYRPTCEMVLPAMQAGPVRRPGVIESTALDLVEVW